jgi:hypothetical protein
LIKAGFFQNLFFILSVTSFILPIIVRGLGGGLKFSNFAAVTGKENRKLIEGIHFYIEKGMYVWTEKYLRERGYCCGSGCRHCPYPKATREKG